MDDHRPQMLVEIQRKLWVGLIIDEITQVWNQHHILSPSQHSFSPRRGTDTALVEVLNVLEQVKESRSSAHSS